jgi:tRNA A37 methylthiotransferase MiaB
MYKLRGGQGTRFADLLNEVAEIAPEVRFRFTSPHPKDFPDSLLHVIAERPNVCKQIHIPAQSGSTAMLMRMRRNHTREAYLNLVDRIRNKIPGVALSSDFIAGFCDETEDEFRETLSLL